MILRFFLLTIVLPVLIVTTMFACVPAKIRMKNCEQVGVVEDEKIYDCEYYVHKRPKEVP